MPAKFHRFSLWAIAYGLVGYSPHNSAMSILDKIGRKIAEIRHEKGLTQEDLAGLAEMDRSYLSEIENGRKNLSVLSLIKIAKALKTDPAIFIKL
jgi:DNA-binding XRE family transcriptional regulator